MGTEHGLMATRSIEDFHLKVYHLRIALLANIHIIFEVNSVVSHFWWVNCEKPSDCGVNKLMNSVQNLMIDWGENLGFCDLFTFPPPPFNAEIRT